MTSGEVVGFGAMNIDRLNLVDEVVIDGEQLVTDSFSLPGGSAANTIYGLAKLGVATAFVGAVGTDKAGKTLVQDLKTVGVNTGGIRRKSGASTGATACFSDKLGRRAIYISPGANNLLVSEDLELSYFNRARIVHLSSFTGERQFGLQVDLVRNLAGSAMVSLSPGILYASKGLQAMSPLFKKTQVVFMNRLEIERLTGRDYTDGAGVCLALGARTVVVTMGKGLTTARGKTISAYIRDIGGQEHEIEPGPEDIGLPTEPTGAGDAFAAGFLYGLLKDKDTEVCGLLGDMVARFAIAGLGARQGLPSLAQLSVKYLELSGQQL